jgi:hypothetical protein
VTHTPRTRRVAPDPRLIAGRLVSICTDGWRGELITPRIPRDPDSSLRSALLNERAHRLAELRDLDFRVYDTLRTEEADQNDRYRIIDRFKCVSSSLRPAEEQAAIATD